jgi:hypothetical protein
MMPATIARLHAHPYKLAVDVGAICLAMIPLWSHRWLLAALIAIAPGLLATLVLARIDIGRNVKKLSLVTQLVRVAALGVAIWAAWTHRPVILGLALLAGAAVLLPWRAWWSRSGSQAKVATEKEGREP